jgi:membrane fusion protein, heavy metal efflux system
MKPFLLLLGLASLKVLAGPGHDHGDSFPAPSHAGQGPVRLTLPIVRNLGLQTAPVGLQPMAQTFPAPAYIESDPARVTAVHTRIAGRVTRLAVQAGQTVAANDLLLELESRVVADPPPRVALHAPSSGVILDLPISPGGAVTPDTVLLQLADLDEVYAVARLFEGQLGDVHPGQPVRVSALARPAEDFAGVVTHTAAQLERETGTLRVYVRVANPEGRLLPGMRVQLSLVTASADPAVVVPRAAVLGEGGDLFVFRQLMTAPFTYERTPVVVGLRDDQFIEIIEGVLPGDRVVTQGNYQLQFAGAGGAVIEDDHGHQH